MVILADFSDTQLQVTCKRCEQTLQEGDRFCRYCGQDQLEGDPSAVIDITQPASNGDGMASDPLPAKHAARRHPRREPVLLQDAPGPAGAPDSGPGRAVARSRWSMGLAAAVLLALAGVLSYDWYVGGRQERAPEPSQAAGGGARVEEKAAPRKPAEPAPVAAETKPADASALGAPAAATAAAAPPAPAPTARTVPELPAPAPATSTSSAPAAETPGQEGACPPAMAAMALCPNR